MKQSQVGVPMARHAQRRVGLPEDFHCPSASVEGVGSLGLAQDWEQEKPTPKQVGRMGEQMAKVFLESHGYSVITMNWRCRSGEADIDPKVKNVRFDVVGLNIYAPLCAKVRLVPGAFEWDE